MKLLVVSHTPHRLRNGRHYGWGPTISEINFLATQMESVVHIAPVLPDDQAIPPQSYSEVGERVRVVPVRNRGGASLRAKLNVLVDSFHYITAILRELRSFDGIVHVRCPANISLMALVVLIFFPTKKKWIKYAGDWDPQRDFLSYRLQRFIIRYLLRNQMATINGYYPQEQKFIHYFLNPSFSLSEANEAAQTVKDKKLDGPFVLLFVGALEGNKRADVALAAFTDLALKYSGELLVVGDGTELVKLKGQVNEAGLQNRVEFKGWSNRSQLKEYYKAAHLIILPSEGEGWPKVISEAMTFGVVPVVSDVSGVRFTLQRFGTGCVVRVPEGKEYSQVIKQYLDSPDRWMKESRLAIEASRNFTLEIWWEKLNELLVKLK